MLLHSGGQDTWDRLPAAVAAAGMGPYTDRCQYQSDGFTQHGTPATWEVASFLGTCSTCAEHLPSVLEYFASTESHSPLVLQPIFGNWSFE